MNITRVHLLRNGIAGRCPNCGGHSLFESGRLFKVNAACPNCGLKIEKGDGAFLGPFVINYGVTAFGLVIPVILLYARGWIGPAATLILAGTAAVFAPFLLYRLSWGWWLALYYFFLPNNLPANLQGKPEDDD